MAEALSSVDAQRVGVSRLCSTLFKSLPDVQDRLDLHVDDAEFVYAGSFADKVTNAYYTWVGRVLGYDPVKTLSYDIQGFKSYSCNNVSCPVETVHLPMVNCGRYHPYTSHRHSTRCLNRLMEKIEYLQEFTGADYLIKIDLTLQGCFSEHLMSDGSKSYRRKDGSVVEEKGRDVTRFRRAVNLFLVYLQRLKFFERKSQLGGFYALHVWKTQQPLHPHVHAHLNLLNVAYNKGDNSFHRYRPWLDHHAVKLAWRKALKKVGLWDKPNDEDLPDVHVGYIKLKNKGRVAHRILYVFRRPIVDLNNNVDRCSWYVPKSWARYLLDYSPRQVCVGWMFNLKRFGFNSNKSFSPRCPVCGSKLEFVEFTPAVNPHLPWMMLDRAGLYKIRPPPPYGDADG